MNFFVQQHTARKKTGRLFVLFLVAVMLMIVALNVVGFFVARVSFPEEQVDLEYWMNAPYCVGITGAVLLVIVVGSLNTLFKLSGGGKSVAQMVGARRIQDVESRRG